jgi:hypothetical protein
MTSIRPCGCEQTAPDHFEPEPDWIGDSPIMHGERDEDPRPRSERQLWMSAPCLCGHPDYMVCPEAWGSSVMGLEIRADDGGELGWAR